MESIILFSEGKIALGREFEDSNLDGKKWNQLSEDLKQTFWNYVLPVEWIDFTDSATLTEAFNRLNRNSRKLERQEIRHSQYDGWFIDFVEKEADDPVWKTLCITTTARVRRMRDYQFLSELALVIIEGRIHGFDQDLLDGKYAQYNDLEEAGLTEQEQSIRDRFSAAKQFLLEMENSDQSISKHASTFTTFYTLWSWAVLYRKSTDAASNIARHFNAFMDEVSKLAADPTHSALTGSFSIDDVITYVTNARGASTDLTQRTERLAVLTKVLG